MSKLAIVTDSASDLPQKYRDYSNLQIVPLSVTFPDRTYLDGEDISSSMFYEKMALSETLPFTSQPTPDRFHMAYESLLAQYDAVISIHLSHVISGTMNSARLGKGMLPDALQDRVHIIDSGVASMVEGLMVIVALEMCENGCTLDEILKAMRERKAKHKGIFMVDSLENLVKGGRISHMQSLLGTLLKLKPLLYMGYDSEGMIQSMSKVRGRKKALREMLRFMKEQALDIENQRIAIAHSYAEDIEEYEQLIRKELNPKEIITTPFGAVIGTHTGKNAIALCFLCK